MTLLRRHLRLVVYVLKRTKIRRIQHGYRWLLYSQLIFGVTYVYGLTLVSCVVAYVFWDEYAIVLVALGLAWALLGYYLSRRNTILFSLWDEGKCPLCGYDLRACKGKCPECGNLIRNRPPLYYDHVKTFTFKRKGFFELLGYAAWCCTSFNDNEEDFTDMMRLSHSSGGPIELVTCLIVAPLVGLAMLLSGFHQVHDLAFNLMVGGGTVVMTLGFILLMFHQWRMQDRRLHVCRSCGASFRRRRRACPLCASSDVGEAVKPLVGQKEKGVELGGKGVGGGEGVGYGSGTEKSV